MLKGMSRSEGEAVMKGRGAITISLFALLLAVMQLISNGNSGKILTNTMMISDTWSFYQSKSIKQSLAEYAQEDAVARKDQKRADDLQKKIDRYETEPSTGEGKKELMQKARQLESERAIAQKKGPWYSISITLVQIALVLSSTAILAVSMEMLFASIAAAVIASALFANGYFMIAFF